MGPPFEKVAAKGTCRRDAVTIINRDFDAPSRRADNDKRRTRSAASSLRQRAVLQASAAEGVVQGPRSRAASQDRRSEARDTATAGGRRQDGCQQARLATQRGDAPQDEPVA